MSGYKPVNVETDSAYNRDPGIVLIPGSNYIKEVARFEMFHTKYTAGTNGPGNPYVYRAFPKMVYRAQHWNGKAACGATVADAMEYRNPGEHEQAVERARRFTDACQLIVANETELHIAQENGWREDPKTAVEYLLSRDRARGQAAAERNHEDRNMGDVAKREAAAAVAEAGEHLPEVPVKRRPGRPRKTA